MGNVNACRHCRSELTALEIRYERRLCFVCDATNAERAARSFAPWSSVEEAQEELERYEHAKGLDRMYCFYVAQKEINTRATAVPAFRRK